MVQTRLHWAEGSNQDPVVHACCRPAISRTKHVTITKRSGSSGSIRCCPNRARSST